LRIKGLSFSFGITRSKREKQRKKAANSQARTIKILFCSSGDGTAVCTVVKIKDTSIKKFFLQKVSDQFYIAWDPKIPKTGGRAPAEPKAVRLARTACIMMNAILPAIVFDLNKKRQAQREAIRTFDEQGVAHDSQDSLAGDDCLDRALLSMDGEIGRAHV
jgi:hypothetical protein